MIEHFILFIEQLVEPSGNYIEVGNVTIRILLFATISAFAIKVIV